MAFHAGVLYAAVHCRDLRGNEQPGKSGRADRSGEEGGAGHAARHAGGSGRDKRRCMTRRVGQIRMWQAQAAVLFLLN